MKRYVALLRGVSPMNCKMPALKKALESTGFEDVVTVLSSGNAVFSTKAKSIAALEKQCEDAMEAKLGKRFATIVRAQEDLQALLEADPFSEFELPKEAKRVVTFAKEKLPAKKLKLPIELDGAKILAVRGEEIFTAYVPGEGPVFMQLIEKTFGKDVTTRTWDTVKKVSSK